MTQIMPNLTHQKSSISDFIEISQPGLELGITRQVYTYVRRTSRKSTYGSNMGFAAELFEAMHGQRYVREIMKIYGIEDINTLGILDAHGKLADGTMHYITEKRKINMRFFDIKSWINNHPQIDAAYIQACNCPSPRFPAGDIHGSSLTPDGLERKIPIMYSRGMNSWAKLQYVRDMLIDGKSEVIPEDFFAYGYQILMPDSTLRDVKPFKR